MFSRNLLLLTAIIVLIVTAAAAQEATIKKVPAQYTSPASAQEMYVNYCAACHGKEGKGNGPAVPALKVPPPDLTTLAKRGGGKFPSDRVAAILKGKVDMAAHGSKDMPIWGPIFWQMSQGHQVEVQQRITNLSNYLQSMQGK